VFDEQGVAHVLPGQVRIEFDGNFIQRIKGKPKFIELLEGVKLAIAAST
jgi:hypothetical protein